MVRASDLDACWATPPLEAFQARPTGRRPRGRTRTRWWDYVSHLARERLRIPPRKSWKTMKDIWKPAATTTRPWLSVRQWMDGWMKVGPFHGFTDRRRDERRNGANLSLHFDLKPVKFCGRNLHGYKNLSTDGHKHLATFSNSLLC